MELNKNKIHTMAYCTINETFFIGEEKLIGNTEVFQLHSSTFSYFRENCKIKVFFIALFSWKIVIL